VGFEGAAVTLRTLSTKRLRNPERMVIVATSTIDDAAVSDAADEALNLECPPGPRRDCGPRLRWASAWSARSVRAVARVEQRETLNGLNPKASAQPRLGSSLPALPHHFQCPIAARIPGASQGRYLLLEHVLHRLQPHGSQSRLKVVSPSRGWWRGEGKCRSNR
jgi:hypothetical protein